MHVAVFFLDRHAGQFAGRVRDKIAFKTTASEASGAICVMAWPLIRTSMTAPAVLIKRHAFFIDIAARQKR